MPSTILADNGVTSGVAGVRSTGAVDGLLALQTTTAAGAATTALSISATQVVTLTNPLPVGSGGTGATSATFVNLASNVTGTLPVANGGTGAATLTGYGAVVMNSTGTAATSVAPSTVGNLLTSNGTSWVSSSPPASGVTSAVAGNGVSVSAATGAVTFAAAAPTWNSVGSYAWLACSTGTFTAGSNYAAGGGAGQVQAWYFDSTPQQFTSNILSGTWKWMAPTVSSNMFGMGVRVS